MDIHNFIAKKHLKFFRFVVFTIGLGDSGFGGVNQSTNWPMSDFEVGPTINR